ncbi:2-hydroxyacid dehydrogenase [Sphingomonas sp. IW22]|uniref:2-hydroxyacid dehydrogenase n=1 Tax=Sphingomonas sp. IW22 TaxID=3242489 RepID=UPI00352170C6
MTRPTILVTRRLPDPVQARLAERYEVRFSDDDAPMDAAGLSDALCRFDALVPTITDRITAEMIAQPGRRARMLANFGAGLDHINLNAAREHGLPVSNTPDALTDATAELAILLMLMASRRAGEGERELRGGQWTGWRPTHLIGQGLGGRTLGLIGFGRIAQATARRARALGMNIAFYNRSTPPEAVTAALEARRMASPEALVACADIVSLHVPGGADTHHLVNAELLAAMRPGAILVNTARGTVVDEAALADALDGGTIAAAALDVYEGEPRVHPGLLAHSRSVLLPHLGSATIETRTAMGMQAIANLDAFFAGREPPNRVA